MDRFTMKTTDYLITRTLKDVSPESSIKAPEQRQKIAYLEAFVSIIINIILAVIKAIFGLMLNSISLIADAVHTASDVLTSVVVILGFKLSAAPPDEKHPHGHGRIEFIASLIISLMLIGVGIKFGINSYHRYLENTPVKGSYLVVAVMIAAALIKEWMSRLSIDMGNRISSSALIADAWHHRTDAIASLLVALAILASQFGYYRVDAVLGFAVSALIIWTGIEIFNDSTSKLIGESDDTQIEKINNLALGVFGVKSCHDIAVHDYGANKVVSLHIEVQGTMMLYQAHEIAQQVEETINREMYALTTVHLDSKKD
ncbi:MAG: cation transporter [Syntrophomonadaceae bacterium]|nr:cation transporter [Syntrophomonadaceae bacterium]